MTNREKLAKMTNEEIVAWIGSNEERICSFSCPPVQTDCDDDCRGCWLNWLNAEEEE